MQYKAVAYLGCAGRLSQCHVNMGTPDFGESGVTGYFALQEIWHPHSIFPRKMGTLSGNLAPPNVVVFFASLHVYYRRISCTPAHYPRISCTPCPLS